MINKKEIKRKLFHICNSMIVSVLVYFNILNWYILLFIVLLGLLLSFIAKNYHISSITFFLKHLDRDYDIRNFPGKGAITFMSGCFIAVLFFSKDIAIASILIMGFGDAVSSLVSKSFGKLKHPLNNFKKLEGTLLGILVSFIAASFFISYIEALFASIIGMIVESIYFNKKSFFIDDNILIPLFSGLTIFLLRLI
ncbi:MAG: hypothetical protein AABX19_00720 [Nanoarchaeota archaeon]